MKRKILNTLVVTLLAINLVACGQTEKVTVDKEAMQEIIDQEVEKAIAERDAANEVPEEDEEVEEELRTIYNTEFNDTYSDVRFTVSTNKDGSRVDLDYSIDSPDLDAAVRSIASVGMLIKEIQEKGNGRFHCMYIVSIDDSEASMFYAFDGEKSHILSTEEDGTSLMSSPSWYQNAMSSDNPEDFQELLDSLESPLSVYSTEFDKMIEEINK